MLRSASSFAFGVEARLAAIGTLALILMSGCMTLGSLASATPEPRPFAWPVYSGTRRHLEEMPRAYWTYDAWKAGPLNLIYIPACYLDAIPSLAMDTLLLPLTAIAAIRNGTKAAPDTAACDCAAPSSLNESHSP